MSKFAVILDTSPEQQHSTPKTTLSSEVASVTCDTGRCLTGITVRAGDIGGPAARQQTGHGHACLVPALAHRAAAVLRSTRGCDLGNTLGTPQTRPGRRRHVVSRRAPRKIQEGQSARSARALIASTTLAACGDSDSGVPVHQPLRQHLRPPASTRSSTDCNKEADGQVQDRRQPAPERRRQPARAVRTPARRPRRRHGPPRHGRHLDRRVRRGRLDPRAHGRDRRKRPPRTSSSRRSTRRRGRTSSTAIPKHTNVQLLWYRKSLVPEPPKTWDDVLAAEQEAQGRGQALRHRHHRRAVRGLRRRLQHDPLLAGRHARQRGQHQGHRRRQDRRRRWRSSRTSPPTAWPASRCRTARSPRSSRRCRTARPRSS